MRFLLVNGYIKFPNFITKDGVGLINKPENEEICKRLELTEVEQPSQDILDAVEGKYFERYSEAKEFLDSLSDNE